MIKTVTVEVKRVINIGNYETVTYGCTASADVNDRDQQEVYNEVLKFCKEQVGTELNRLKPKKDKPNGS